MFSWWRLEVAWDPGRSSGRLCRCHPGCRRCRPCVWWSHPRAEPPLVWGWVLGLSGFDTWKNKNKNQNISIVKNNTKTSKLWAHIRSYGICYSRVTNTTPISLYMCAASSSSLLQPKIFPWSHCLFIISSYFFYASVLDLCLSSFQLTCWNVAWTRLAGNMLLGKRVWRNG